MRGCGSGESDSFQERVRPVALERLGGCRIPKLFFTRSLGRSRGEPSGRFRSSPFTGTKVRNARAYVAAPSPGLGAVGRHAGTRPLLRATHVARRKAPIMSRTLFSRRLSRGSPGAARASTRARQAPLGSWRSHVGGRVELRRRAQPGCRLLGTAGGSPSRASTRRRAWRGLASRARQRAQGSSRQPGSVERGIAPSWHIAAAAQLLHRVCATARQEQKHRRGGWRITAGGRWRRFQVRSRTC